MTLKHFSDCLFYFCSTCADSIIHCAYSCNFSLHDRVIAILYHGLMLYAVIVRISVEKNHTLSFCILCFQHRNKYLLNA